MQVQRCPECGIRLKTNYCDVCMKKVPFSGVKMPRRYTDGSSAHRDEGHECISFDIPEKKKKPIRKSTGKTNANTQKVKASAIVLAALSVISTLFGTIGDLIPDEPDYSYEQIIEAGESGAENVPNITPTVLYEDGEISVTADYAGLYFDDYTIFLTIENNSAHDIIVNTGYLSVNDYMLPSGLYQEVEAGESVQGFLTLYTFDLEQAGIKEVASITFQLEIFDAQDYDGIAVTDLVTIETEIADTYEQPVDDSGWDLYLSEDLVLRLKSTTVYYGDCELLLYIENLSDRQVNVSAPTVLANGQEVTGNLWCTLRPGTRAVTSTFLYGLYDEEGEGIADLTQIGEISMDLHIEYMEDWYVEQTINGTVAFNPNDLPPVS